MIRRSQGAKDKVKEQSGGQWTALCLLAIRRHVGNLTEMTDHWVQKCNFQPFPILCLPLTALKVLK